MATDPADLAITRIGAQGDGVAETAEGPIHVARALPGEVHRLVPGGPSMLVGDPSPERRREPLCPHFPACGGCSLQHMSDALYRVWKGGLLEAALAQHAIDCRPAPLIDIPIATRRRATLTGRFEKGAMRLGFHGARSHDIEPIEACAVLVRPVVSALPILTALAARLCPPSGEVRLSVLAADNGLDVTAETEPRRKPSAREAATLAGTRVLRMTVDGEILLQAAEPTVLIGGVAVVSPPGAFLQAARETEGIMAELVVGSLGKAKRVADLFAGLGTISLPIAARARVLAVDSDRALLTALARAVRGATGLKPVETLTRDLFRDPLSPRELDAFDAVVLDPPRAGARAQTEALARSKVPTVVMVSCNPATLARDLRTLLDAGYRLESATPIDQFHFTPHLEAVAVLRRPRR